MQNQRAKWKKKKKSPSQQRSGSVLGNHTSTSFESPDKHSSDNHTNHYNHFGNQHENNNTNDVNYTATTNFDINWRLDNQPLDINLDVENWNPDSFNQFML